MKTNIGGDRLGSGGKQEVSGKHFNRSTHDLSSTWRSTMAAGTLVPFMNEILLPADTVDLKLACEVLTLPTIGPLFGSYKVQLDVFTVPLRLYNAGLHINRLGIGNDMSQVYLPKVRVRTNNHASYVQTYDDNEQINSSSLYKYLGISGLGNITGAADPAIRFFNASSIIAYYDIYKNYYANLQEEIGYVVHTTDGNASAVQEANLYDGLTLVGDILATPTAHAGTIATNLRIQFSVSSKEPDPDDVTITVNSTNYTPAELFDTVNWDDSNKVLECSNRS